MSATKGFKKLLARLDAEKLVAFGNDAMTNGGASVQSQLSQVKQALEDARDVLEALRSLDTMRADTGPLTKRDGVNHDLLERLDRLHGQVASAMARLANQEEGYEHDQEDSGHRGDGRALTAVVEEEGNQQELRIAPDMQPAPTTQEETAASALQTKLDNVDDSDGTISGNGSTNQVSADCPRSIEIRKNRLKLLKQMLDDDTDSDSSFSGEEDSCSSDGEDSSSGDGEESYFSRLSDDLPAAAASMTSPTQVAQEGVTTSDCDPSALKRSGEALTNESTVNGQRIAINTKSARTFAESCLARCRQLHSQVQPVTLQDLDEVSHFITQLIPTVNHMDRPGERLFQVVAIVNVVADVFVNFKPQTIALVPLFNLIRESLLHSTRTELTNARWSLDSQLPFVMAGILPSDLDCHFDLESTWSALTLLADCDRYHFCFKEIPVSWLVFFDQNLSRPRSELQREETTTSLPLIFFLLAIVVHVTIKLAPPNQISVLATALEKIQTTYEGKDGLIDMYLHKLLAYESSPDRTMVPRLHTAFDMKKEATRIREWLHKGRM